MKQRNRLIILALLCSGIFITAGYAQQDSQFTQYMYNTETINPAYAGTRGIPNFTGIYRNQWVGIDGAPETFNFTANTLLREQIGLGFNVVQDKIGPSDESTLTIDFSYILRLTDNFNLSFGLKGGINLLNVDFTRLNIYNPTDPEFQYNIDHRLTPIIGTGIYIYNDISYFGISVPNLLETTHFDSVTVSNASEKPNFYVIGGYVFNLNSNIKFKPALLGKFISGAPTSIDASANFLFNKKFTLGAAYRLDAAVSALAGFQISDQIMVGYTYDFDTTKLGNYNSGSHEIFLRFEIFKLLNRAVDPRFF
ncbi:MAG: type IX secretion system membrane protein PorP/SprF [Bacteroidetes bacterium]|nr:type IX secretion system membrane protein PorP/SprF [Bacteroidota bacterium]